VKVRRLLVVASAVLALSLACVSGQLRGVGAAGHAEPAPSLDSIEALLPILEEGLSPPPSPAGRGVFVDSQFPPSRMATADVFRPPQA